jgi:hypothetical protein
MITTDIDLTPDFYGQKTVILGKSGSGKSYTARVVVEEGIKQGVTFTIIDPQGAYGNLEGFEYLQAKNINRLKDLGHLVAATARNVVINMKGLTIDEQGKWVKEFLEGYRVNGQKGIRTILIDEAHKFAPEYDKVASKDEVRSMSQENRSDGLGFIAVEQRSQRLDKTVLSQADYLVVHRLTAKRDLMAVEAYLDNPKEETKKIKNLDVGEALFVGFKEETFTSKVREAFSEHTGSSPQNLLKEDSQGFSEQIKHLTKKGDFMTKETVPTKNEPVKNIVPSMKGFKSLAMTGAKMSVGLGAAGIAGAFASRFKSPIPMVSSRTIAGALTTVAMYAGYRMIKNDNLKDFMFYGAAGAAVGTFGSLVFDALAAAKVNVPPMVTRAISFATSANPVAVSVEQEDDNDVDLNTQFN